MDTDINCMCFVHAIIPIIGKVVPYAFGPIQREAGYLIFYEGNFTDLIGRVKNLEAAREAINHRVEAATRSGKIIEVGVLNWLEEVIEVTERTNKHLEDPCRRDVGCSGWVFPNLITRYRLGRKTAEIATDVAGVFGRGDFNQVGHLPALNESASSSAAGGAEKLMTRESFKESIMKALRDPKAHNIGVYGLGGVGKTTLVNEVFEIAKQQKLFDAVVIARVSKTPDIKEIQGVIADMLGLRFEEETTAARAYRLRKRIEAEKTVLVILDDIWLTFDLEKMGIPSSKEHNGCKLLMTSKSQDVLRKLDVQKDFTFRLEHLNEVETWSLFQSMAGDVVNDIGLKGVATQIAQNCAGLPLLIVTVARGLKSKDIHVWKDALMQLQNVGHEDMDDIVYSALDLSYRWLASDEIKTLFLLSAVLGYNNVDYLLKVAMGLDIFKNVMTVDDARNRLHSIIESLKASCLLLEGSSTSRQVQMHDLVRDVAISIARRDKHVYYMLGMNAELKNLPKDFQNTCSQIILLKCLIHELPQNLDCPNVNIFILDSANRSLEIPDTIFDGMGSLTVLDLTHLNLSSLPTSFRSLTGLQTLCLDQCVLENMDIIEDLKSLKILSLWKSSMIKLPSKIREMAQLRMLDLSHSGIEVIPPNIISSLTKLEELYMGNTSIKWEDENSAEQKENASLAELRQLDNLTTLELQIHEFCILPVGLTPMFEKLQRYKIAIGDVWEWSDIKDGTLKTLMLKLGTNIHLEHGIKALIKGVEKLYLDEVEGIENVLYQMNGEGFPLLKHLHIQNNNQMKHIVESMESNQVNVSFPNLETLLIDNLQKLEQICYGPLAANSFGKLSVIKVKNCVQLKYLLSLSMVKGLVYLSEIEVCGCNLMKNILIGDHNLSEGEKIEFPFLCSLTLQHLKRLDNFLSCELTSSKAEQKYQGSQSCVSTPFFNVEVAFPNLETLKLSSLSLNKIWDNQHSMDKLTVLVVENCDGLKSLFSSTMVGSFENLKRLEISKCNLMNEIIATEKRNDVTIALKEVSFPKLESIILKDMENLKTVWHYQFQTSKVLQVQNCEKIVTVFPSSMQKTYNNLEQLLVENCALVEEIFELTSIENSSTEVIIPMKVIILGGLPKLKNIWSMDPQGILSFHSLQSFCLYQCESMEYLFPLSVATSCLDLKELVIRYCGNMKEIVSEKRQSTCTSPIFEFNQLTIIQLGNLYSLKAFYAGNHTLRCPSLRTIDVTKCKKLNLYNSGTLPTSSLKRCKDENLPDSFQQPLFIIEEVVPNLKKMKINQRDAKMLSQAQNLGSLFHNLTFLGLSDYLNEEATFPYLFLENAPALEDLVVGWSSFKTIFDDEILVSMKLYPRLKMLNLYQLSKIQHLCEEHSQIHPILEGLEELVICYCPSLTNVLPSSVTFSHLTYLEIVKCNNLVNVITSTTAQSLVKLTVMKVRDCDSLEEIITGRENVDIAFVSLQILIMKCLPSLNKFCSSKCFLKFPLLEKVIVSLCPRLDIFSEGNTSTPYLRKVIIEENDGEWIWKGNLNDTIKEMFDDKVAFSKIKYLALSDYPELKEYWYGRPHQNMFHNLKSLVVQRCDFLSHVLLPSNVLQVLHGLENLEVKDCDSLEALFDVKDPYEIISFGNLCRVNISKCQSLLYILPLSLCQDLGHLEVLMIEYCEVKQIVALEETSAQNIITFDQLTKLQLYHLKNLISFYPGKLTLECPSLKILDVSHCEALNMFSVNLFDIQQHENDIHDDIRIGQGLFSIEKLSLSLEKLAINGSKDALRLLNCYSQKNIFSEKLKLLSLHCFDETPISLLNNFHAIFPNLATLRVHNSAFERLFPTTNDHLRKGITLKIKFLGLYNLEKLEYIWQENFSLEYSLIPDLETLVAIDCPSLIRLVPSSTSFTNLTALIVNNCKELVYLISPSTATSLMQLKILQIENCEKLLDVIMIDEGEVDENIIFENLEQLKLTSLSSLRSFCYGKHKFVFPSFISFIVEGCPQMEIFSPEVTIAPYLTSVEVENKTMYWKGDLNTTIEWLFMEKVAFPNLETLKLSSLNLNKIWDNQHSMDKLTVLVVENCDGLKSLFSSTMVGSFENLKRLEISKCNLMNEIIATEKRNDVTIALKEVSFPKLESIILKDMENLKTVWHYQFQTSKVLQVQNCEKIVTVFPSSMQKTYNNLERLLVENCALVEEIFELTSIENSSTEVTTLMKVITLDGLPKLKNIWSMDPQGILSFHNLQDFCLNKCGSMEYLFPLSIATSCPHLEKLHIRKCWKMKEIVSEERQSTYSNPIFEFNQLTSIQLWNLPSLKGFYAGNHTLACPSLRTIIVLSCEKLNLYKTGTLPTSSLKRCKDEKLPDSFLQPLFIIEEVVPDLKNMRISQRDAKMLLQAQSLGFLFPNLTFLGLSDYMDEEATFPYWFLQNAPALESLVVEWSSFKKIFEDEIPVSMELHTRLKELRLYHLSKLQHICDERSQIHQVLEGLEQLVMFVCPSLTNVLPSFVTFSHLTYLEIIKCNRLVNVITSATAQSLVKLTVLKVRDCDSLEEIITGKENVDIAFASLEILILKCLPSLNKFCSSKCCLKFPLLEKVIVCQCPRMKIFSEGNTSTPYLRKVIIEENDGEWIWKGNLNDTIKEMFDDKSAALVEWLIQFENL
ncbi:uncharacterized protein LOC131628728 isoform X2 [Vicia villosa]|uniref:uncharacterized protein LOC131628728 isoform X2 n=1 Tax=Vicia villosa TaxID=3911 RepID=UPI00273C468E|nr:uncharacterized protein LOC131628728 isoform X2 [Vicia villosa]